MPRRLALLVVCALVLGGCGSEPGAPAPAPPAAGAILQGPVPTGGLEGGDLPVGATLTGAPATALARVGDTVYAAGTRWVAPYRGSAITLRPESGALSRMLGTNGQVSDAVADGRGGVFLAGDFDRAGRLARRGIVHVFGSGLPDEAFRPPVRGFVSSLVLSRGILYAGGSPDGLQGRGVRGVVALDSVSGKSLKGFATDVAPGVTELAVRGGTLYVGGSQPGLRDRSDRLDDAERAEPPLVALDKLTGERQPAFAPEAIGSNELFAPVTALEVLDGKLWVARALLGKQGVGLSLLDPVTGARVGRTRLRGDVHELVRDGRRVLAVGSLQGAGGTDLVRALSLGNAAPQAFHVRARATGEAAYDLVVRGSELWVGGMRSAARVGEPATGFVRAYGASGRAAADVEAPTPDGPVNALVSAGGRVVVGGDFAAYDPKRLDLAVFSATTGRVLPGVRLPRTRRATALASAGGRLWVLDGRRLLVVDPATGGTVRTIALPVDVAPGEDPGLALTAAGGRVFVSPAGRTRREPRGGILAFDATSGAPVRFALPLKSADPRPPALLGDGDTLWVGGSFDRTDRAGAPAKLSVLKLDARTGRLDAGFDPHVNGPVRGLATASGRLSLSGLFTRVGGLRRRNLAAVETGTGAAIAAFEPGQAPGDDGVRLVRLGTALLVRGQAGTARAYDEDGGPVARTVRGARSVSATIDTAGTEQLVTGAFRSFSTLGAGPVRGVVLPPKG